MTTDVEAVRQPTEVLIPEARQRQRRRYVRTGIVLALTAFVIAALIAAAIAVWGGAANGKSQAKPPASATGHHSALVFFRPVFCIAPPYNPAEKASAASGPLTCSPTSELTFKNLNPQPLASTTSGFSDSSVPPDAGLAGVPSTSPSADEASATVLLPGLRGACDARGYRCVLGPAEMSSALVKSATVTQTQYGAWVVDYVMTSGGARQWDRVANENFHQELAIELNGTVYSAPLIQPAQSSFSSFDGRGEISGSLTRAQAERLAHAMDAHSR